MSRKVSRLQHDSSASTTELNKCQGEVSRAPKDWFLFEEVTIAWNIIFYYLVQGILKISR